MSLKHIIRFALFLPVLAVSCTPDLEGPKPKAGDADFSRTVAVGGNYMAGYQDGALYRKGQQLSIPVLLAEQFKLVGGSSFSQVLMPDNNGLGLNTKPWESWFVTPSHLGNKTDCKGVTSLSPLKNQISLTASVPYLSGLAGNSIQDFAVPFANIADYFNPSFGDIFSPAGNRNPFYNRIASTPGSSTIFTDAKNQNASFVTAWVGMEDIYNFASTGGTSGTIPSPSTFSMYLDSLLEGLTANGAKGVIANIPDFRNFPYYTLIAYDNAVLTRQSQADSLNDTYLGFDGIHFIVGRNGFLINDPTTSAGARHLHSGEYITLSVPIDSMKCDKYGLIVKLIDDRYALDSSEVYEVDQAISGYNAVIAQKAAQYNFALVDMYSYFTSVKAGIKWNGVDFNETFVTGGFFSLDGYHPNQKGYALIANKFLEAICSKYNSVIPTINCVECDGVKFP
jgi:hypothetical protein